jgi:hypothetical protein
MRRTKSSSGIVKTISLSAAIAALSSGSFMSAAGAVGDQIKIIKDDGSITTITVKADMSADIAALQAAFLAGGEIWVSENYTDPSNTTKWKEFGVHATAAGIFDGVLENVYI